MAKLHFIIALDASKSMVKIKELVISEYNKAILALDIDTIVSIIRFRDTYEILYFGVNVRDIPELTDRDYILDGCTRYSDSIDKIITEITTKTHDNAYKMLIISDQEENCSTSKSKAQADAEIQTQKDAGWIIEYVGVK
jgi:hypothetical protein